MLGVVSVLSVDAVGLMIVVVVGLAAGLVTGGRVPVEFSLSATGVGKVPWFTDDGIVG